MHSLYIFWLKFGVDWGSVSYEQLVFNCHYSMKIANKLRFLCVLILSGLSCSVWAEWHQGMGEEYFGSETAEKTACRAAESKAISNIVQRVVGETISSSQLQICHENNLTKKEGRDVCQLLSSAFTYTEATVVGLKKTKEEMLLVNGKRACQVFVSVNLIKESGVTDTGFDPDIRLKQVQLHDGDSVQLIIKPTQPFFLNLFVYSPYLDRHEQVRQIYPNEFEGGKMIVKNMVLPSKDAGYDIAAQFPANGADGELAGEMILAVATKTERKFRPQFALADFNTRLQEIPRSERRVIQLPYFIWASKSDHKLQ